MIVFDKLLECYHHMTPFQAAFGISLLVLYILHLLLKDYGLPPGPNGLPLVGYWPFLKTGTCHIHLQKLAREYGDVFSFRVGGTLFIHLGSIKAIKEAHVTKTEYFAARFTGYSLFSVLFHDGLSMISGEPWKVLRKFFVQRFKEYGMNAVKENATCSMYEALQETVQELYDSKGQPVHIVELITVKCLLILRRILFNNEGISREELEELNHHYCLVVGGLTNTNFLLIGYLARVIIPFKPSTWRMKRHQERIDKILLDVVNRHKKDYEENHVTDIIDHYFKEKEDRQRRGDPTANFFTDESLVSTMTQILTDGTLTIGLLIGTYLMKLVEHPEEQERVYKEILEVVGPDRLPTIEDKAKLPYTNAFLYEVMRTSNIFPLFSSLECTKETTLQGYTIPEGSITLINTYAAHFNPDTYEDPETFNPSRFLSSPDKPRAELPVAFGVGKRVCIGEAFSMIQSFLILTTIVKNFRLSYPEGKQGFSDVFWAEEKSASDEYLDASKIGENVRLLAVFIMEDHLRSAVERTVRHLQNGGSIEQYDLHL